MAAASTRPDPVGAGSGGPASRTRARATSAAPASVGLPALIADSAESAATQFAAAPDLLFRAGDAADLAERLDRLIAAPDRLAHGRARALEIAAHHAFERSVRKLEAVYATTVS